MKNILRRSKLNPILRLTLTNSLENKKVYNPGVIFDRGEYLMYYRAVGDDGISRIRLAISDDGENFVKQDETVIEPKLKIERRGVEDARIQQVGCKYYMTYTAYDGKCARLCFATSNDLEYFRKQGKMLSDWDAEIAGSFNVEWDKAQDNKIARKDWNKAGGIFGERIAGKYWMLFGDRNIWLASSKYGKKWQANNTPFIGPRDGYFDSVHVEMGPPPIETDLGWLVLYHGIDEQAVYRLGYLLLDIDNPMNIIKRSDSAIFEPSEGYELEGEIDVDVEGDGVEPEVVFCNGAVLDGDDLRIYYGAGDSVVCMAVGSLKDVLGLIK